MLLADVNGTHLTSIERPQHVYSAFRNQEADKANFGGLRTMRISLKAYKYAGILKKEFKSVDEAKRVATIVSQKYPNIIFRPSVELDDIPAIDFSDFGKDDTLEHDTWKNFAQAG